MNGTATTPFVDAAPLAMEDSHRTAPGLPSRMSLKPYGDELLTRSGDFWIFCARLIILAMALAEAMAWGYMGSLMSREYPWITGAIAATFVFTLIWVIDASFMTMDLARRKYDRELLGRDEGGTLERWKVAAGIAARILIVSTSLIITAPFLAQAIFSADVREEIERRNAALVSTQRQELEAPYLARLAQLREEQGRLEEQRVSEAAGTGLSGRYGRGPAVETIELQLADKRAEIAALEQARVNALTLFDGLSREQLEEQYGLPFLAGGIQASTQLLDQMLQNPQFRNAEYAVRAFLAFLFIGLLILKGFQPRSVAVYYSERLHSAWDEYRKGVFDPWLPAAERAGNGGQIDPLRFEDWCLTSYRAIRSEDERRKRTARESQTHQMRVEQWRSIADGAMSELQPLLRQRELAINTIHELEAEISQLGSAGEHSSREIERLEAVRSSMQEHIARGEMDGDTFEQAMRSSRETAERRARLERELRETTVQREALERRLSVLRADVETLDQQIASRSGVVEEAQRRISEERMRLAEAVAGD